MSPANLVTRNGSLALDSRPIAFATASRALLDDVNGTACCCGGLGRCVGCCAKIRTDGPRDAAGYCCFSTTDAALKTQIAHAYYHHHIRDPINNKQWIYEATGSNLPLDIGYYDNLTFERCGGSLAWNWNHTFIDFDGWREETSGTDQMPGVNRWLIGSFLAGDGSGRFLWAPVGLGFIPISYNGNFRNVPPSSAFLASGRASEDCDFVSASWEYVQSQFHTGTITIQALVQRNVAACEPRSTGGTPCANCP